MTTAYDVEPHGGVGPVRFGMTRAEARAAMPAVPTAFGRGPNETPVDTWNDFAVQVFYDADDRVEYIEIERDDALQPVLFGTPVLTLSAERALAHVCRHADDRPDDDALPYASIFPALDLAFWRPHDGEEDAGCFASLGVAARGTLAGRFIR